MGMFDGVHLGHQSVLKQLSRKASEAKGESVLLTFDTHPRLVLQKDSNLRLITSLDIKIEKLKNTGLNHVLVLPFTKEFSRLSALEFVRDVLVERLGIGTFLVGYDHHFGKNREGNHEQLQEFAQMFGFELFQLEAVDLGESAISSTKIRRALGEGDLRYANKALGEAFAFEGKVVEGDKIGRTIGFPTANLEIDPHQIVPKTGVYEVEVAFEGNNYHGMMNIGNRPSVGGENLRLEVNLFDFSKDIYGESLGVKFISRLRDERKFESLEELEKQLEADKQRILKA